MPLSFQEVINNLTPIQKLGLNLEFLEKVYYNNLTEEEQKKYKLEIKRYKYFINQGR